VAFFVQGILSDNGQVAAPGIEGRGDVRRWPDENPEKQPEKTMKNIILALSLLCTLTPSVPAMGAAPATAVAPDVEGLILEEGTWGGWGVVSAFPGLEARVRRGRELQAAGRYMWHVEYRNNYSLDVYIGTNLTERGVRDQGSKGRIRIASGKTRSTWFGVNADRAVTIWTSRVRLGSRDSGPYLQPKRH
jgi:hypothetical protein